MSRPIPRRTLALNRVRLVGSFRAAFAGLAFIVQTQPNWRIHCAVAALAILGGFVFRLQPPEWALLFGTIGGVLALEALNTAIEATIDALPGGFTEEKRHAKDAAAAAVLLGAVAAVGVGIALFGPRILSLKP